jgi:hypothetical protein
MKAENRTTGQRIALPIARKGFVMKAVRRSILVLAILSSAFAAACASTGVGEREGSNSNLLTREEILGAEATNLYDVVRRLRPRWLQVRSTRSFGMETQIVVLQNDMHLGNADQLKEMSPELAFEIEYIEGGRAANILPGLMSGQHIEGAIVVRTRQRGGD